MTEQTSMIRIDRDQYPEIIQAVRWSDEDNGTNHFEPGVGFVVDDPDGLLVPDRWLPHLPAIESALAGLDHEQPHPEDEDTIQHLAATGEAASIYDSAVRSFVCGEHSVVMAMAHSSQDLWVANRFLNEYFEGWEIDPAAGWIALEALGKVSAIRDSIIGAQTFNWSEHAYPLVAALGIAGFPGAGYEIARKNVGTLIEQIKAAEMALQKCRDQFAFYATEHEKAGKTEKAAANQSFVAICDAILSPEEGRHTRA